jgi:acetyl-CoA acetyltransferase
MENKAHRPWPAPLGDRVADDASAGQIADAIVALWQEIDQALHPIIGHRGVAALCIGGGEATAMALEVI